MFLARFPTAAARWLTSMTTVLSSRVYRTWLAPLLPHRSLSIEPLFLCPHLGQSLRSLRLSMCHIDVCGRSLATLDFLGRLRGLTLLELSFQAPSHLRRSQTENGLDLHRPCVSLWALSSLVSGMSTIVLFFLQNCSVHLG